MTNQDNSSERTQSVQSALRIFHPDGTTVELRALRLGNKRAICEISADLAHLARRAAELSEAGAEGVYFTLNPLSADLVGSTASCRKADVVCRHWLPLDIDPVRPPNTSSTDSELKAARNILVSCRRVLELSLHHPVIGCSGNGWHLCYPILTPNDDDSQALVKDAIAMMSAKCGSEAAKIDPAVHDAPRIWKMYGTLARKGPDTLERPHRLARLISGEPWDRTVAEANTVALRELVARWKLGEDIRRGRNPEASGNATERARKYVASMPEAVSGQQGHQRTWDVAMALMKGFALTPEQAWPILLEYNSRCQPPWSEAELRHKMTDAASASLEGGYLLNGAQQPHSASQITTAAEQVPSGESDPSDPSGPSRSLRMTALNEVIVTPVRWLVPDMIPLGKLTLIAGDGGHGKSAITLDLIACLTTGRACLGTHQPPERPADALLISCEDDLADTVVPRLMAAGADLRRVQHLDGVESNGKDQCFSLADHELLDQHLAKHPDVRLVVIDPVGAYIGGAGVDDHKDSELRSLLAPLSMMAASRAVAIVIVKHLNKGANTRAVARVGGSVGYINAVRSAMLVAPDLKDSAKKYLLPLKSNLARKPAGRAYQLTPCAKDQTEAILNAHAHLSPEDREQLRSQLFRVVWLDEDVQMTADEAVTDSARKQQMTEAERAAEWLRGHLADGPKNSNGVREAGNDALGLDRGLDWWRDKILKGALKGKPTKVGKTNEWLWVLPGEGQERQDRQTDAPFLSDECAVLAQ